MRRLQIKLPVLPRRIHRLGFWEIAANSVYSHLTDKKKDNKRKEEGCQNRIKWVLTVGRKEGGGEGAEQETKRRIGKRKSEHENERVWNQ